MSLSALRLLSLAGELSVWNTSDIRGCSQLTDLLSLSLSRCVSIQMVLSGWIQCSISSHRSDSMRRCRAVLAALVVSTMKRLEEKEGEEEVEGL